MNRWLIMATIVFSCGIVMAAPAPAAKKAPAAGDKVVLQAKPSAGPLILLPNPRLGDPDSPDFESNCQLAVPFEAKVLGTLPDPAVADIVVAEYHSSAKDQGMFNCRSGSILLFSQDAWTALKAAEEQLAKEKAEQQRRREAVREIIRQNQPAK